MEISEILSSTDETVKFSPRYEKRSHHSQTKTTIITKTRRGLLNRKKKHRQASNPTDSTATLLENPKISQSLNNHNLKLSLKSIYDQDPVAQLKHIFNKSQVSPKHRSKEVIKNHSCEIPIRRKHKVDSIFQHNEADLIMSELKTIKSPEVWQQVVQNFKKRPSALMDLIPIDYHSVAYPFTPSSICQSPKVALMHYKICSTPTANSRRHYSSNASRFKVDQETPKITRQGSANPIEVVTFLEEKESEKLTDDWAKSMLYKKIASGEDIKLAMTEQEMTVISRKPPREPHIIKHTIEKGLKMLRTLLMELLGTKEDMERFENRFKGNSPVHVRALMERCINLMGVRNMTADILADVNKRELIMKNLERSKNKVKEKVLKVYSLNKVIREKIMKWVENESVPFSSFVFQGKEYLDKICEDSVMLQEFLARVSFPQKILKKSF